MAGTVFGFTHGDDMNTKFFALLAGAIFFLLTGVWLTFFTERVRLYNLNLYKKGIEDAGFLRSWIDSYPGLWFFRAFGILSLAAAVFMIVILIRKIIS